MPAVIRGSAEWEGKRVKKKKNPQQQKRKKDSVRICSESNKASLQGLSEGSNSNGNSDSNGNTGSCIQDVWCGPGIGFSSDVVGSVDCVVARRNASGRGKIDGDNKINQREREVFFLSFNYLFFLLTLQCALFFLISIMLLNGSDAESLSMASIFHMKRVLFVFDFRRDSEFLPALDMAIALFQANYLRFDSCTVVLILAILGGGKLLFLGSLIS